MVSLVKVSAPKSNQLNACDFVVGSRTFKISKIDVSESGEQRVSVFFDGEKNPWKPCKTQVRAMMALWNTEDSDDMVGKSVTLYCDASVIYGGEEVGGIRISHVSDIKSPKKLSIRISQKKVITVTIHPLVTKIEELPTLPIEGAVFLRAVDSFAKTGNLDAVRKRYVVDDATLEKIKKSTDISTKQE